MVTQTVNSDGTVNSGLQFPEANRKLFADRIEALKKEYESVSAFARSVGVAEGTIRKWASGSSDPKRADLIALARATGVRFAWLLVGEGPMRGLDSPQQADGEFALVPRYDVQVSAGGGACVNGEEPAGQLAFQRQWLARQGVTVANAALVEVRGDSMEPTLADGDIILLDRGQKRPRGGYIYVVRFRDELFVKRLQLLHDGTMRMFSDNPRYEDDLVAPDAQDGVEIIGRAVWSGGKL